MKAKPLVAIAALIVTTGCTDRAGAIQAAEAYGLSDVEAGDYAWFGCGKDDDQRTAFTATNAQGQRVEGVVCGNWGPFGKYNTVRIARVIGEPLVPTAPLQGDAQ